MILGIGCDIVDSGRIQKLYEKTGEEFLSRILSSAERERFNEFEANSKQQISYLAKRFAAKEAVSKALGIGIGKLSFCDVSIINNDQGAPIAVLPETFSAFGGAKFKIDISISDEWPMALAFVVVSGV